MPSHDHLSTQFQVTAAGFGYLFEIPRMLTCTGGWDVPMAMGMKRCLEEAKLTYRCSLSTVTPLKFSYGRKKCSHCLTKLWPHQQWQHKYFASWGQSIHSQTSVTPGQWAKARSWRDFSTVGFSLEGLQVVSHMAFLFLMSGANREPKGFRSSQLNFRWLTESC